MRLEILSLLRRAGGGRCTLPLDLGAWDAEIERVVEWLARRGFVRCAGTTVSLTASGAEFVGSRT